jgi:tight adherence protein B
MQGALLFSAVVGLFVLIIFVATWRLVGRRDPVDQRLKQFGVSEGDLAGLDAAPGAARRLPWSGTNRMLAATGMGPKLANALTQADLPLTAAEFVLIMLACFVAGAAIGAVRLGLAFGIALGLILGWLPVLYLNRRRGKRQRAFTNQIPEILALLVGALRAGFGISQAMGTVVNQLAPPASVEFGRAVRAMSLGLPLQRALIDLARRAGTDEIGMIVMAINIQHETGGNLAQTLDTIGETVRERLRVKGEIRTLTSQQRLTGMILAGLPIVLAGIIAIINPAYLQALLAPGIMRLILIGAILMQIAGFLVIRRIVDIEV